MKKRIIIATLIIATLILLDIPLGVFSFLLFCFLAYIAWQTDHGMMDGKTQMNLTWLEIIFYLIVSITIYTVTCFTWHFYKTMRLEWVALTILIGIVAIAITYFIYSKAYTELGGSDDPNSIFN